MTVYDLEGRVDMQLSLRPATQTANPRKWVFRQLVIEIFNEVLGQCSEQESPCFRNIYIQLRSDFFKKMPESLRQTIAWSLFLK